MNPCAAATSPLKYWAFALLLPACTASDELTIDAIDPSGASASQACTSLDITPEPARLKRLTMAQYRNTLRDLVHVLLPDATDIEAVIARAGLDALPDDRRQALPQDPHGSYRRLDQALEQVHVDGTLRVATLLAASLTEPAHLGSVVGACAVDNDLSNDATCLQQFVQRVGSRIARRPLAADDEAFYAEVFAAAPRATAYADLISVMLEAPEFLYFVEHGAREVPGRPGVFELSAHELAARLSYQFWQSMPDDELWQSAQDGTLLQAEVYERQVQRLINESRARSGMLEFFADWLKVEELPELGDPRDPRYVAFAGTDLPTPLLRQHMIDEVLDMVSYYTWNRLSGLGDLFTSELSFARASDLAGIYGVAPWNGVTDPPALPAGQRPGLLTRGLFLANASANTRPIMKGVFVRRRLLCDDIPPPPAGVGALQPELREDMTTRQVVTAMTEQPGSECAACHASLINPLGFATESFDALGRFRTDQRLFSADGTLIGSLPVDTHSVPRILAGDANTSDGPADLARQLVDSGKLETCFARNYFRYTFGRWDDPARDACAIERMRARITQTGSIAQMLVEVALTPAFRQRTFD